MAGDEHLSLPAAPVAAPSPRRLPRSRALGRANRVATLALVGVLVVLAVGVALRVAGATPLVERSGSMAPAIETGDVVLVRDAPAARLAPGQIVTLADPIGGRLVTHRVASVGRERGHVVVVTRGDANASSERWVVGADASVQRMVGRIPAVGRPLLWLSSPLPRTLLAVLGAGLLAAALLRRIWSDA